MESEEGKGSGDVLKPRCLFGDGDTRASTPPTSVVPVGPQEEKKKPAPKRVRKAKRAETATPEKPKPNAETDAAAVSSPPVKREKKRSKNKQAEPSSGQMAAEPSAGTRAAVPVPVAEPVQDRKPSERAYKKAMDYLIQARKDSAHWFHALRLWKAIDGTITKATPNMKKFDHWSFSMYWGTFRCGLLQKQEKKWVHIVSYGGGFCRDIGLPLEATYMYVPPSVYYC